MVLVMTIIRWLNSVKKNKHILIGILICGLYFINVGLVNFGVEHSIIHWLNNANQTQLNAFLDMNSSPESQLLAYYTLVFKMMFVVYTLVVLVIIIVHRKKLKAKIAQLYRNRRSLVKRLCFYLGFLLILTALVYLVMLLALPATNGLVGENQSVIDIVVLQNPNFYIFAVVIILSPIVEEYIFRYGLINNLLKNKSRFIQIIISSSIFAFVHIGLDQMFISPEYLAHLLLLYLPMSIVYSWVYVREQNIAFPLVLHCLNNIGSIIVIILFK